MVAVTTMVVVTTITCTLRNQKVNGSIEFGKAKRQTCDLFIFFDILATFFKTTNKNRESSPEFKQLRQFSLS
jgi:hypothetical protein